MTFNNPNDNWRKRRDDSEHDSMKTILITLAFVIMWVAIVWLLSGCTTTKYVPVIEHTTDTLVQRVVERDSIHVHDSIRVSEKGDTVTIERWHTKYIERTTHDTIYQATHDTLPLPYPVEVVTKVEKPLTWWQRMRLHVANIVLLLLVIYGGAKLWKLYRRLRP